MEAAIDQTPFYTLVSGQRPHPMELLHGLAASIKSFPFVRLPFKLFFRTTCISMASHFILVVIKWGMGVYIAFYRLSPWVPKSTAALSNL